MSPESDSKKVEGPSRREFLKNSAKIAFLLSMGYFIPKRLTEFMVGQAGASLDRIFDFKERIFKKIPHQYMLYPTNPNTGYAEPLTKTDESIQNYTQVENAQILQKKEPANFFYRLIRGTPYRLSKETYFFMPTGGNSELQENEVTEDINIYKEAGWTVAKVNLGLRENPNFKTEFIALYKRKDNLLAIGFTTGIIYKLKDGQWVPKRDSSGRLLKTNKQKVWAKIQEAHPQEAAEMYSMIQKGTKAVQQVIKENKNVDIVPNVIPLNLEMPWMSYKKIPKNSIATTEEEAKKINKPGSNQDVATYFYTEQGHLIDKEHLLGTADKAFQIWIQIEQAVRQNKDYITVYLEHKIEHSDILFAFTIDLKNLKNKLGQNFSSETVLFYVMQRFSIAQELSQRFFTDSISLLNRLPTGGFSPEDLFTNTLAIVGILEQIKKTKEEFDNIYLGDIAELILEHPDKQREIIEGKYKGLTDEQKYRIKKLNEYRDKFKEYVLTSLVKFAGVHPNPKPITQKPAPLGLFEAIPIGIEPLKNPKKPQKTLRERITSLLGVKDDLVNEVDITKLSIAEYFGLIIYSKIESRIP